MAILSALLNARRQLQPWIALLLLVLHHHCHAFTSLLVKKALRQQSSQPILFGSLSQLKLTLLHLCTRQSHLKLRAALLSVPWNFIRLHYFLLRSPSLSFPRNAEDKHHRVSVLLHLAHEKRVSIPHGPNQCESPPSSAHRRPSEEPGKTHSPFLNTAPPDEFCLVSHNVCSFQTVVSRQP